MSKAITAPDPADQPEEPVRKDAVRWLSPSELTSAAVRVGISSAFGEYADKRESEALRSQSRHPAEGEELPEADEVWVDYVSDTGDGFAATYAVAHALAQPSLTVEGIDRDLPRGRVLFHGGDLVYPTASVEEYQDRFIGPYVAALPDAEDPKPEFYAVPGNHDWYDGLTSFIRVFCDGSKLGGWRTPQHRSYFSVQITEHWWVWGIDIQFDGFIDTPQIDFFRAIGDDMVDGLENDTAGIILASAKPSWAKLERGDTSRPTSVMNNLDYLVRKCVPDKAQVRINMAGDSHFYSRYHDTTNDTQFVTAGGGGAYLSATHHLPDTVSLLGPKERDDRHLVRAEVYPSQKWSRARRWQGPLVGWRNPSFASLLGAVYLALAWLALGSLLDADESFADSMADLSDKSFFAGFESIAAAAFTSPGDLVLLLALTALLMKFSQAKQWWKRAIFGGLHAAAQVIGLLLVVTIVATYVPDWPAFFVWLFFAVGVFVLGAIVASIIFGTYLGLADVFRLHDNELFAGLRIEDRKNFLRMRITDDEVECWAIALHRVPPKDAWTFHPSAPKGVSRFQLDTSATGAAKETTPRVIDHFTVPRRPPDAREI